MMDIDMALNRIADIVADKVSARITHQVVKAMIERSAEGLKKTITLKEACEIFKRTPMTLSRWHKQGKLPKRFVGRSVYYNITDIENLLRKGGQDYD